MPALAAEDSCSTLGPCSLGQVFVWLILLPHRKRFPFGDLSFVINYKCAGELPPQWWLVDQCGGALG